MKLYILAAAAAMAAATTAQAQSPAPLNQIERGHQLYDYWCATCHGPGIGNNGARFLPGTNALATKYKGEKPALLAERTDLTPEVVKLFVRNGVSIMPFFRKTEIGDKDLDAIAAYLSRNIP